MSRSRDLKDALYCTETLSYTTMRQYSVVMETYEEMTDWLMNCYVAFFRFYDDYTHPSRYVWVNKDADTPFFHKTFGYKCYFLGEVKKHQYKLVKEAIRDLGGRTLVIERDWYIRFRDSLVLACY